MSHLEPERLVLLALGEGTLDQHETGHLDACERCRAEMDELRDVAGLGRQTQRMRDLPPAPEHVWDRIRAELAASGRAFPPPAVSLHTDPPPPRQPTPDPLQPALRPLHPHADRVHPTSVPPHARTQPPALSPHPLQPTAAAPGMAVAGTAGPGMAGPGQANQGQANPGTANPGTANPGTAGPGTAGPGTALAAGAGRRWRQPGWVGTVVIAAAAAVAAAGVTVAVLRDREPATAACRAGDPRVQLEALPGTPAGVTGHACLVTVGGDRKLLVHAEGMPRQDGGDYEAWLLDSTSLGGPSPRMQALGVMGGGVDQELTVPGTLDLSRFNVVDISAEPHDGNAAHSGHSLLRGRLP